ncbi:TadE/TadG family type IV pilus assembly protein [Fusibacter sp. 3D3]|uniref:TadE/TadG family type IV pilus assembly protein n=1 Tax=Fusibacter sp. 3D3 TaxID=1048380 RepID=UPI0008538C59|nr:TadE family protein [Fusibacter sp. 3D3]GAU76344.1 Flp pilus assembly protein TadG [Fusibacter sp. 3D3]
MKLKIINDEKGQAVVEFAVVLPVLLLIILATITIGMMIYTQTLLVLASSQAARTASYVINDESYNDETKVTMIKNAAYNILNNGINGTDRDVDIYLEGGLVSVKVSYKFRYIFPLTGEIFDKSEYNLSYTTTCVIN